MPFSDEVSCAAATPADKTRAAAATAIRRNFIGWNLRKRCSVRHMRIGLEPLRCAPDYSPEWRARILAPGLNRH
ncbi:hypothetical protein GCM10027188_25600 [Lysobacter humi (ex Lee et al. 2017)]